MKRRYSKRYLLFVLGLATMVTAAPRLFADECGGDFNGWICGDGYGLYGDPGSPSNGGGGGWNMNLPVPTYNPVSDSPLSSELGTNAPPTDSPVDLSANIPTSVNLPSTPPSAAGLPPPVVALPDPTPPSNPVMTAMNPLPPVQSFTDNSGTTLPGGAGTASAPSVMGDLVERYIPPSLHEMPSVCAGPWCVDPLPTPNDWLNPEFCNRAGYVFENPDPDNEDCATAAAHYTP